MLSPGNKNPIAGQTAVVKLDTSQTKDWILKRNAGVKFSLRNEALMPDREPTSRAGLMALIRDELNQAKAHQAGAFNPRHDVLKRVVDANLPAYICAYNLDEIASAMTIVDEFGLTFDILLDPEGEIQRLYQISGYPTTFIIDSDGVIRVRHIGIVSDDQLKSYLTEVGLP